MKLLLPLLILSSFTTGELLFDEDPNDFKDPLEQSIYQDAMTKLFNMTNTGIDRRIVGGEIAASGQFPYMVALHMWSAEGVFICGGALVRFNWVLTAAHCIFGFQRVQVLIGTINRVAGPAVFNTMVTNRRDLFSHPHFSTQNLSNDIGLIHLRAASPALLHHPHVDLITLPDGMDHAINLAGFLGNVSGFGMIGDNMPASDVLRFVTVPIISNEVCAVFFGKMILPSNMCVGTTGGRSPCRGDSGGPLVVEISQNRTVVVGVVSFGGLYCSIGIPVAFARITSFNQWINSIINSGSKMGINSFIVASYVTFKIFFD